MKKISLVLAVLLLSAAAMLFATNASSGDALSVYGEYKTDNNGYQYGVDFYVDNNTNVPLYVFVCITSRDNVTGDKAHGVFIINPHESRVRVASFISSNQNYAWSVNIRAYYAGDERDLPYVPNCN